MENHAAEDAGVRYIEGRPAGEVDPEIQKIDHVFEAEPVDQIAKDAGADEPEDDLHVEGIQLQGFAIEENGKQGNNGKG